MPAKRKIDTPFPAGTAVVLVGLKKNPHLNGMKGVINRVKNKDKFDVKLQNGNTRNNIMGRFLRKHDDPELENHETFGLFELLVGNRVVLAGLVKNPRLNGVEGIITKIKSKNKFDLKLDNGDSRNDISASYFRRQYGKASIQLLRNPKEPFPSIKHKGEEYVIAEKDAEYKIQITLPDEERGNRHSIEVNIDGQPLGYSKGLDSESTVGIFHGFKASADFSKFKAYRFASVVQESGNQKQKRTADNPTVGRIIVWIYRAPVTRSCRSKTHSKSTEFVAQERDQVIRPDTEKFWKTAGVATTNGSVVEKPPSQVNWVNWGSKRKARTLVETIQVRYDLRENLELKGIITPKNQKNKTTNSSSGKKKSSSRKKKNTSEKRQRPRKNTPKKHNSMIDESYDVAIDLTAADDIVRSVVRKKIKVPMRIDIIEVED